MKRILAVLSLLLVGSIGKAALPAGLYLGGFQGQESGDFILALDSSGTAYVAGYSETYDMVFVAQTALRSDNSFDTYTSGGVRVQGTANRQRVSGTAPGITFSAQRLSPDGKHETLAGLYIGKFTGTIGGDAYAAVLPDGRVWFLSFSNWGSEGGKGTLASNGSFDLRSYLGTRIRGSIGSSGASGTWSGDGGSGSFSGAKVVTIEELIFALPFAAQMVSNGWSYTDWLGWYVDRGSPWVWHLEHGWWYVQDNGSEAFWAYDPRLGWIWVEPSVYPWLYVPLKFEWQYFEEGTSAPRWMYSRLTGWYTVAGSGG
jgi:hypothetical protein